MDNHPHHSGREHRTGDLLDSNLWNFKHLSSCNAMSQLQKYFRCIEDWRGDFTNVIRHFSLPMLGFSYLLSPSRGRMSGERSAAGAEGETAWPEHHPQHHQTTGYRMSDKIWDISGCLKLSVDVGSVPGLLQRGWSRCSSRPCPSPPGPHCWGCSGSCPGCRHSASRGQPQGLPSHPHCPLLRCLAWCWCNHSAPCSPACCCNQNSSENSPLLVVKS